jgi:CrcB protein
MWGWPMWGWVALAGALGALARFGVHRAVESRTTGRLPWGTVTVNVVGSFTLAVIVGLVLRHGVEPDVRVVLGTGFLGSFTTFSAFAFESFELGRDGAHRAALGNAVGGIVAGLLAATLGLALTGAL